MVRLGEGCKCQGNRCTRTATQRDARWTFQRQKSSYLKGLSVHILLVPHPHALSHLSFWQWFVHPKLKGRQQAPSGAQTALLPGWLFI